MEDYRTFASVRAAVKFSTVNELICIVANPFLGMGKSVLSSRSRVGSIFGPPLWAWLSAVTRQDF